MNKFYIASLCREGILGGSIIADDEGITFKTGKLTVSPQLRNLGMRYTDIQGVSGTRLAFIPTVTVTMKSGESYKFIVFGRKSFLSLVGEKLS